MPSSFARKLLALVAGVGLFGAVQVAEAQTFGVELQNTLMPASGAMAGASNARPQDLTSALNGNPATITQFQGTQFSFAGTWAEPTFNLTQTGNVPPVGPELIGQFSGKSEAPGVPNGNIGLTQEFTELGIPVTIGVGFITTSGAFADFRQIPESHGTNTGMAIFSMPIVVGANLTERLAIGVNTGMGIAFFDGPFVGSGGMTADYALRATLGATYALTENTQLGAYYQTEQKFGFANAFVFNPGLNQRTAKINMDLPQNVGVGIANNALMDGKLLLAADLTYKMWDEAALYDSVYDNQWVVQLGAQYSIGKFRLRAGYAWAQNPIDQDPEENIGGVVQEGGFRAVRYTQGLLAVTSQNRISGGVGIVDVLPGVDFDLMAGGMLADTEQLGEFTTTTIQSYWVGAGLTWRFARGGCDRCLAPNSWSR